MSDRPSPERLFRPLDPSFLVSSLVMKCLLTSLEFQDVVHFLQPTFCTQTLLTSDHHSQTRFETLSGPHLRISKHVQGISFGSLGAQRPTGRLDFLDVVRCFLPCAALKERHTSGCQQRNEKGVIQRWSAACVCNP